jgi:hypothetical protein
VKMKRRKHTYTLRFDEGPAERIVARSATEAVAARTNPKLPYSITDEVVMARFLDRETQHG